LTRKIVAGLRERGSDDIPVLVGGAIPPSDVATLREAGAAEVFPTGALLSEVIAAFKRRGERRG